MSSPSLPVRLAFCITDLDPGGAERALVQIVTRLDRGRWEPAVYCLSPRGDLVAVLEEAGIPVTCFGARGLKNLGVIRQLSLALKNQRPELLQTFLFHANLIGRLAARWAGVPHTVSGIRVAEKRANLHLLLDRMSNSLVDCNVCVSRAVADFSITRGGLRPEKTVVIPNGVDYETFAHAAPVSLSEFGIPEGSRVVVTVGRLDPQKGLTHLLPAFQEVSRQHDDIFLLIVGEGVQRKELQAMVHALGMESRVRFAGWRGDVANILRTCNVLVLASLWEGMANVILEGMAAGIPLVATAVEGVSEQIASGENGIVVPAGSATALAAGLNQMLGDNNKASVMAVKAQRTVMEHFTWTNVVSEYEQLWGKFLRLEDDERDDQGNVSRGFSN